MFNDITNSECAICKSKNSLIINYQCGEITCNKCGAVNVERLIDEQPEERNFNNEYSSYGNQNKIRYGSIIDYEINDELNDVILLGNKRNSELNRIFKRKYFKNGSSEKNKIMNKIWHILNNICSNLDIQKIHKEKAQSLLLIMYNNGDLNDKLLIYFVLIAIWIILKKDDNVNNKILSSIVKKMQLDNVVFNEVLKMCKQYYENVNINQINTDINIFIKSCKLDNYSEITNNINEMVTLFYKQNNKIYYGRTHENIAISFIFFCINLFEIKFVINHNRSKERNDEIYSYKEHENLLKLLKKVSKVKIKKITAFYDIIKKNINNLSSHSQFEFLIQPNINKLL